MKKLVVGLLALISAGTITAFTIENKTNAVIRVRLEYTYDQDYLRSSGDVTVPANSQQVVPISPNTTDVLSLVISYYSDQFLTRSIQNIGTNDRVVITGNGESTIFATKQ